MRKSEICFLCATYELVRWKGGGGKEGRYGETEEQGELSGGLGLGGRKWHIWHTKIILLFKTFGQR